MVTRVSTVSLSGLETKKVDVQIHVASGLPGFNIVGLADKSVAESKERIRASFQSIGLALPAKRITINLAPANLVKEGSHYDLPIAIGLLAELDIIPNEELVNFVIIGELALDNSLTPVKGILPIAMAANNDNKGIICPYSNRDEAAWSGNKDIISANSLSDLINHFTGKLIISSTDFQPANNNEPAYQDFADVRGQKIAKRAMEIAAAGGHNLMMIGPPGSGKSMLAKRLPGILPPLTTEEMLQISTISSIAGLLTNEHSLEVTRPYRDPHSSSSLAAMVGGGKNAKPGEITLAHCGILFLDELPEFSRNVLESLRQPVETGEVTIARVNSHVTYPARFQLIAAMNPCKCGYYGDIDSSCNKAPKCAQDYQNKISGPLFDRFDIRVDVINDFNNFDFSQAPLEEKSSNIRKRVIQAQEKQLTRYKGKGIKLNAHADGEILQQSLNLDTKAQDLMSNAIKKMGLSMRGINRILRVSRTIADLANCNHVSSTHLAEALNYRTSKLKT